VTTQTLAAIEPYDPTSAEGRAAAAALTRVLDDIELAMRARGVYPNFSSPASLAEGRVGAAAPAERSACGGGRSGSTPVNPPAAATPNATRTEAAA
jgi:hypothetical protein